MSGDGGGGAGGGNVYFAGMLSTPSTHKKDYTLHTSPFSLEPHTFEVNCMHLDTELEWTMRVSG